MVTTKLHEYACVVVENPSLRLLVTQSVGPRILSLQLHGSANLLAELPDFCAERPDGQTYHFYGGHRLWVSPEDPLGSYALDNRPVTVTQTAEGVWLRKPVEPETNVEKALGLTLAPQEARLTLTHQLTNQGFR